MDAEEAAKYVSEDARPYMDNIVGMLNAPFFALNGMKPVSISLDRVEISMDVKPRDRNSNGFWHGGTTYGVLDHAFAILTNIRGHAVGQNSNLNFYRPGRGDTVRAVATVVNESGSLAYCCL
ncbi:Uncharacterized protein, possibly involved in aromatic compounds catabolism [Thermoplasmatales archaeon BRNA1]|nr:Uncharacterized protein, possibly involved in aromatic compounds catabolism [Thermoplasmatales archaeon BRNA1]